MQPRKFQMHMRKNILPTRSVQCQRCSGIGSFETPKFHWLRTQSSFKIRSKFSIWSKGLDQKMARHDPLRPSLFYKCAIFTFPTPSGNSRLAVPLLQQSCGCQTTAKPWVVQGEIRTRGLFGACQKEKEMASLSE